MEAVVASVGPNLLLQPDYSQYGDEIEDDCRTPVAFLPLEVLLNHVVAFLRPRDVAALAGASKTLRALDPHAHVRCIKGKFRSSSLLLKHLLRCPRLATLDLRGNRLTSDGIRALGEFLAGQAPSTSTLETLDLSALSLTSLGIRLLAQSLAGCHQGGVQEQQPQPQPQRRRLPLKALMLAVNNAGDDGAAAIGDLLAGGTVPQLEEANVSNSVITFRGLGHLARGLSACPRLRRLNLSNNPLFEIPGVLFPFGVLAASEAALAAWDAFAKALPGTLESLSVFNALLSAVAIRRLVLHWRCPALLSLNLSWNRIGADGASALAHSLAMGACPALQSLNLSHCVVTRAALADLTRALSAPRGIRRSIQHLNLGWNPLNAPDTDAASFAEQQQPPPCPSALRALAFALARCPNLETLTLSNVQLGDEGAVAVVQGFLDAAAAASTAEGCLSKLAQLDLSWNAIGPEGITAIAGLFTAIDPTRSNAVTPALQSLDISYNAAGSAGLRAMAHAWSSPSAPMAPGQQQQQQQQQQPRLPPGLILHVIGNKVPRCACHFVPATRLGQLLDEIDAAASAAVAAAAAAMATFGARHTEREQAETKGEDMLVACTPASSPPAAIAAMDHGTQTQPALPPSQAPQTQQHCQQAASHPILSIMAPLPATPDHPRPRIRTAFAAATATVTTMTASGGSTTPTATSVTGGRGGVVAAAAAAAARSPRRSARMRRTATATLTAPYLPPSSSEGYYLTTRNRRRRLCTHAAGSNVGGRR